MAHQIDDPICADVCAWLAADADRLIETHCAWVVLKGDVALKLKRPVDLGYLDFSTRDKRRWALERELDFNRATAPTIYRTLRTITRNVDGGFEMDGPGEVLEWALEMRRFDDGSVLSLQPDRVQGDLAERVRAWRGLSAVDGMALPSLTMRGEASSTSLFSQSSGQLQQFADSLRMAVNQADAPSLLPATERSVSTSTSAPATAPGALSSAAAAAPADAGGAWRADNLQMPALNGVARPAAGTLQFLQTMQPSNFGAPLGETFGQNAWAESVTQRVALMTGLKLSSARIELDPPELGAMTVKVSVSGDQASVSFVSPHAHVRDALEQNFPRLQEMLGQQGLQLADAQVSDQSAEQRQSGESASGSRSSAAGNGDERGESVSVQNVNVATSLIDYYA